MGDRCVTAWVQQAEALGTGRLLPGGGDQSLQLLHLGGGGPLGRCIAFGASWRETQHSLRGVERTCAAVGRLAGSLTRHLDTSSRIALLKCFLLVSAPGVTV